MTKILLISAATSSREVLAEHLTRNGYQVFRAERASKGLTLMRATPPDLVIVDQKLPDMDSLSLCVLIRQDKSALSQTALAILTDVEHEAEMGRLLDSGADDYILRQSNLSLVLPRLRALLRRTAPKREEFPSAPRIHQSGKLRVDSVSHRVHLGAEELKLSHKEYELLTVFIQNPGIALSRDFLLSQVWGSVDRTNSRTLDVHVRWLREKIEDDSSHPSYITTIRSVGYRFDPA